MWLPPLAFGGLVVAVLRFLKEWGWGLSFAFMWKRNVQLFWDPINFSETATPNNKKNRIISISKSVDEE